MEDGAKYMAIHVWALRQIIRKGKIPFQTVGRGYILDSVDMDRYLEKNKVGF